MTWLLKRYSIYRLLAAMVIFSLVLALMVYVLGLRPRQQKIKSVRREVEQLNQRVRRKDYPLDRKALEKIQAELENIRKGTPDRPGIEQINRQILGRAEKVYLERIRKRYGSRKDFIQRVTRLDFQEEYFAVLAEFQKSGYGLQSEKLGISEKSLSPYTYQLMLQLWTLDALRQCILSSGTVIHSVRRKARKLPEISVLPIKAYTESERKKEPYLLEFPVRVTVTGEFPEIRRLLTLLMTEPYFLPVRHVEIFALPPAGARKQESIMLKLECAGYFIWEKTQ